MRVDISPGSGQPLPGLSHQPMSTSTQPQMILHWFRAILAIVFTCLSATQLAHAQAGPTLLSVTPANQASGVGATTPIVFTFSSPLNQSLTFPLFTSDDNPDSPIFTRSTWSADGTKLTCTPISGWPTPNKIINWMVNGFSASFQPLDGETSGSFTTGSAGASASGYGTNQFTVFSVSKVWYYNQAGTAAPTLDPQSSYGAFASITLASNRTATATSLTLPSGTTKTLLQSPFNPELSFTGETGTDLSALDALYPNGTYTFKVAAASSNQQVAVNLPASLLQPPTPRISNLGAAQAVDPSRPFTLTWDAFAGGTAADYIMVQIGTNFMTASLGAAGTLPGTATSVIIPANTLPSKQTFNNCSVAFYRYVATSNSSYLTWVSRASSTAFTLTTSSPVLDNTPITLSKPARTPDGAFGFEITAGPATTVTVEFSTNLNPGSWTILTTTQSSDGHLTIKDPGAASTSARYYRARKTN